MVQALTINFFKNSKSCGNRIISIHEICKYLSVIAGYDKNKRVENITWNFCNPMKSEKNEKSFGNQFLENIRQHSRVHQTKRVQNMTWKNCNFLKSDKVTILEIFCLTELSISYKKCVKHDLEFLLFESIKNYNSFGNLNFCLIYAALSTNFF